jgi:proline iminopeptidase
MLDQGRHTATVNGLQLGYTVTGNGPSVFVTSPGWGIGSTYLRRGLAPLLKDFTLICIDTRGSGASSRPADESDMGSAAMADDIEQLRRQLGFEQIDLMGHSNGSAIATSYAERYGPACRKLVLIDSQLIGFGGGEATREFLVNGANDPRYRDAIPYTRLPEPDTDDSMTQFVLDLLPLYFHDPVKNVPLLKEHMEEGLISAWASHTQRAADRLPAADQTARLGRITADTLILVGRHDWICPPIVSERLHAGIAGSKLVVFEEAGHMPWIEQPASFLAEVASFLRR